MELAIFLPSFFLFCYIGESTAADYASIHEELYAISWHLCPLAMQKNVLNILMVTQKPVYFDGLFSYDCSNKTFKKVSFCFFFRFFLW